MAMKSMNNNLKYVLVYTLSISEKPYIHGYGNEEARDYAFANYQETGRLLLRDLNLGTGKVIEPVYVARFNMIDGTVNELKAKGELGVN